MDTAAGNLLGQLGFRGALRGEEFVRFQREGCRQAFDGTEPNLLFASSLDLLKEILREIGNLRQFLLCQIMALAQFSQSVADSLEGRHPSDRGGCALTLLPVIAWIS